MSRLDLCIDEDAICDTPACDPIRTTPRRTVLHELGHVWEYQNVDETTRQTFLDLRGLEAWDEPGGDDLWIGEGIEQAAETIAWGLMDQPIGIKLLDTSPDDMAEAFRLLTGVEPLYTP